MSPDDIIRIIEWACFFVGATTIVVRAAWAFIRSME